MGSHGVTCRPTEVTFPLLPKRLYLAYAKNYAYIISGLTPAEAGTRLSDPGVM